MYQKGSDGKSTAEHSFDLTYSSEDASISNILRKCILAHKLRIKTVSRGQFDLRGVILLDSYLPECGHLESRSHSNIPLTILCTNTFVECNCNKKVIRCPFQFMIVLLERVQNLNSIQSNT